MYRKLIIIANEGSIHHGNYLPGVSKDVEAYLNFFRSDIGGAWEDYEIAPRQFGWTVAGLRSAAFGWRMAGLDYVLIVFAGHGYAERHGDPHFELSAGEEVNLSQLVELFSYQKMLLIADSCQGYLEGNIEKALNEVVALEHGGVLPSRHILKDRYNREIDRMSPHDKAMAAAVAPGEYAQDSSKGGLYSRSLLEAALELKQRLNGPTVVSIDQVHAFAAEKVKSESQRMQNPTLYPQEMWVYPPFMAL